MSRKSTTPTDTLDALRAENDALWAFVYAWDIAKATADEAFWDDAQVERMNIAHEDAEAARSALRRFDGVPA